MDTRRAEFEWPVTVDVFAGEARLVVAAAAAGLGPAGAVVPTAPASAAAVAAADAAWLRQAAGPATRVSAATLADLAPHFVPLTAAGGLVETPDQRLLLIHRLGHWDLPKGKVEPGEGLEAAARREITEETGLTDLRLEGEVGLTYHVYEHKGQWVLKTTHWYRYTATGSLDLTLQVDEQIDDAEWVPRALALLRQPMYASIRALLAR